MIAPEVAPCKYMPSRGGRGTKKCPILARKVTFAMTLQAGLTTLLQPINIKSRFRPLQGNKVISLLRHLLLPAFRIFNVSPVCLPDDQFSLGKTQNYPTEQSFSSRSGNALETFQDSVQTWPLESGN